MEYPDDLYYNRDHIWVRVQGSRGTIGITDYAQREMGEILFLDLPEEGSQVEKEDVFGTLESSKTVAELHAPSAGKLFPSTRTWRRSLPWSTTTRTEMAGWWWWRSMTPTSWKICSTRPTMKNFWSRRKTKRKKNEDDG